MVWSRDQTGGRPAGALPADGRGEGSPVLEKAREPALFRASGGWGVPSQRTWFRPLRRSGTPGLPECQIIHSWV